MLQWNTQTSGFRLSIEKGPRSNFWDPPPFSRQRLGMPCGACRFRQLHSSMSVLCDNWVLPILLPEPRGNVRFCSWVYPRLTFPGSLGSSPRAALHTLPRCLFFGTYQWHSGRVVVQPSHQRYPAVTEQLPADCWRNPPQSLELYQ